MLDDLVVCGVDCVEVVVSCFLLVIELMVSYVYDIIYCGNLVGFFGMVLVLEGISVVLVICVVNMI